MSARVTFSFAFHHLLHGEGHRCIQWAMQNQFAIVDLFAGPGGLAEGFSSVELEDGSRPFHVALSVEKERFAHSTLLLRSFLRQFGDGLPGEYYDFLNQGRAEPDWPTLYPDQWKRACQEALCLELGNAEADEALAVRLDKIKEEHGDNIVLIGGPPCQAYSLVGRARNRGKADYVPGEDHRHYLYQSYIEILARLRPAAFVMENVKGMLSSSVDGVHIFSKVLQDLKAASGPDSYRLLALTPRSADLRANLDDPDPTDFVIEAERHGVPQARHRVIVVGLRADIASALPPSALGAATLAPNPVTATVNHVLGAMPALRSGLSRELDTPEQWRNALGEAAEIVLAAVRAGTPVAGRVAKLREQLAGAPFRLDRSAVQPNAVETACPRRLGDWLTDPKLDVLPNNETRSHMRGDLARYFFAAAHAAEHGRSPKAADFPPDLAPAHKNWESGKFADRFRVQIGSGPATTVTSHIAKDGHYFIHPDPLQCRSLTVREAARLQTFPDNYLFKGNRTEQYIQVGNAVPPFLAYQIAGCLARLLIAPASQACSEVSDNCGDFDSATPEAEALAEIAE
jgi:DNA (cytosine-5)-methyltransferase 1